MNNPVKEHIRQSIFSVAPKVSCGIVSLFPSRDHRFKYLQVIVTGGAGGGAGAARITVGSGGAVGAESHTEQAVRKREVRLMKNREAARECRNKKKEYIKGLENRVAVLENQNKALIEELKSLKELYTGQKS